MDQKAKVAIVMPYYNELDLLKKSIDGILKQSWQNWKLFIVDDGSINGNRADHNIIQNRQIKIINKPNSGVSDARNRAIDHLQAEGGFTYVAYCDADDIWDFMHLEESIKALEEQETDMLYSLPNFRFADGSPAYPYGVPFYDIFPGLDALKQQNFIYISGVLHKYKCLEVGGFDRELNSLEDWDMWLRIAKAGYTIKRSQLKLNTFTYTCKLDGNGSRRTDEIYQKVLKKHDLINNTNS